MSPYFQSISLKVCHIQLGSSFNGLLCPSAVGDWEMSPGDKGRNIRERWSPGDDPVASLMGTGGGAQA